MGYTLFGVLEYFPRLQNLLFRLLFIFFGDGASDVALCLHFPIMEILHCIVAGLQHEYLTSGILQ